MRKEIVTLGTDVILEGLLDANVSLKNFREQLKKRSFTEVGTIYKAGKHIVTFVTAKLTREQLIDLGYVKATKQDKR